ncbi:ATP-binding protein [Streptomyces sp. NPDC001978]|uniref:ATP-binding protein n=1 Tax=Streptomyces sp. NPDC001978 TaxID=3364627 RepID=UPI00369FC6A4
MRGRDRETAAVREALETVRGGRGACVVVEGAPGVGKSRLLAELNELARRSGFDVVSVRAKPLKKTNVRLDIGPIDPSRWGNAKRNGRSRNRTKRRRCRANRVTAMAPREGHRTLGSWPNVGEGLA